MGPQGLGAAPALQFRVGEGGMDGAVADRMDRHRLAPAAAFGNEVMMLDPPSERTAAQEAGAVTRYRRSQWTLMK